jgi:GBP family porin
LNATYFGNQASALDGAGVAAGSSAARFNNMIGGTRVDNALKYQSPSLSGVKLHAMFATKEPAVNATVGRIASFGTSYGTDNVEAALIYHERHCAEDGGCPSSKAKDSVYGIGAAYKVNGARYGMVYTRQKNSLNVQGNDAEVFSFLAIVPLGQWIVGGGFQYLNDRTSLNYNARQFNLATTYVLSKRTSLYGIYSRQLVQNGGKAGMYSVSSTQGQQTQLSTGVVHRF